ncbi:putative DCC family thiol-disulfide oxidoreductase YuxK [Shimia isoporae]|uniref:Putative DCC family thiol-disulfide oxidoreductase YuxK n=1 Tax=Shimia isoporae TaxID=647720 RepID=A0A4R1N1U8_9RHOB|nr:DCC1-like thiol-disulfide oxidoreductase family protein [Shimia isoporae]TCL00330.1 putative DCC family thiol-disulfide oxidoreductase YuxK [Shimia isoporae]
MTAHLREPFSFESLPEGTRVDRSRILLVMDGQCALCSRAARFIAAHDSDDRVRISPAQSELGQALLLHFGMKPDDPDSWLMLEGGMAYGSLDAVLRLARQLHWGFAVLAPLGWLPVGVQDWIYARIARNRYAVFGRDDLCALPSEALRRRLVE